MSEDFDRVKRVCVALYEAGMSAAAVGGRYGYGSATVLRWLEEAGTERRSPEQAMEPRRHEGRPRPATAAVDGRPEPPVPAPASRDVFDEALAAHNDAIEREYAAFGLAPPILP